MPTLSTVAARRKAIEGILEDASVGSQAELLELLAGLGFQTTQPVLSRDLRALKVAKRDGIYQLLANERVTPLENLQSLLRDARLAGPNLVVLICEPGAASAVARALEAEGMSGLVGAVAGDDTVLAAVLDGDSGRTIQQRVLSLVP